MKCFFSAKIFEDSSFFMPGDNRSSISKISNMGTWTLTEVHSPLSVAASFQVFQLKAKPNWDIWHIMIFILKNLEACLCARKNRYCRNASEQLCF